MMSFAFDTRWGANTLPGGGARFRLRANSVLFELDEARA